MTAHPPPLDTARQLDAIAALMQAEPLLTVAEAAAEVAGWDRVAGGEDDEPLERN